MKFTHSRDSAGATFREGVGWLFVCFAGFNHLRFLLLETTYWLRLTARKGTASFARVSAVFETAAATSLDSP